MTRSAFAALLTLALVSALPAQQTGDADRNYVVNSQGSGETSPHPVTVVNSVVLNTMGNQYFTQDPDAPVALIGANTSTIGWFTSATNSVDIGPAGLQILLDGLDPSNPFAPFTKTNASGFYSFGLTLPPSVLGSSAYFMMLHAAATSPDGFWVSQTLDVTFDPVNQLSPHSYTAPTGSATTLTIGDDASVLIPLGFTFDFYGTSYTEAYVNSNGNITFAVGNSDFTESSSELASGPRRIAVWWDDLNPSTSGWGTVAYEQDNSLFSSGCTVWWANVPEFSAGGLNSFSCRMSRSNIIQIGVNDFDINMNYARLDSADAIVGISPGSNIFGPAPLVALDLSTAPHTLAENGTAYYEQFSLASNPSDVDGHRVHFDLDTNGYPSLQN